MAITKKAKSKNSSKALPAHRPKTWRDAIRVYLAKAPGVDAVFVSTENCTVHVYSVVKEIREKYYKGLLKQEDLIEKAFPKVSFEFHTSAHQGREPHYAAPWDAELVYLR